MQTALRAAILASPKFVFAGPTTLNASFNAAAWTLRVKNPANSSAGMTYTLAETVDANTISSLTAGVVTVSGLSGLTNPFATYTATPTDTRFPVLSQTITAIVDPLPTITVKSPLDDATGVVGTVNIVATFSAPVEFGTGNILLIKTGPTTVETFDVVVNQGTGNGTVSLSADGLTLTINPTATMAAATVHWINIAATCLRTRLAGAALAAIADSTTWNFTIA